MYLNKDYEKDGRVLIVEMSNIKHVIWEAFHETYFSLLFYCNYRDSYDQVVLTFGEGHKYYEIDYLCKSDAVLRCGRSTAIEKHSNEEECILEIRKMFVCAGRLLSHC